MLWITHAKKIASAKDICMHLLQIFLPVRNNNDKPFPKGHYTRIRKTLTKEFGGLTAYTRAPAEG
jgi:hypothetical protein